MFFGCCSSGFDVVSEFDDWNLFGNRGVIVAGRLREKILHREISVATCCNEKTDN